MSALSSIGVSLLKFADLAPILAFFEIRLNHRLMVCLPRYLCFHLHCVYATQFIPLLFMLP